MNNGEKRTESSSRNLNSNNHGQLQSDLPHRSYNTQFVTSVCSERSIPSRQSEMPGETSENHQPTQNPECNGSNASDHGSDSALSSTDTNELLSTSASETSSFGIAQPAESSSNEAPVAGAESRDTPTRTRNDSTNSQEVTTDVVSTKLQQIKGYIQQTTSAMQALEQASKTDSDQYQTLEKVLRDLKNSDEKLQEQLTLLEHKPNEQRDTEHGSARVGVVGSMNEPVNPMSMRERLARQEIEQNILSTRLRESVAKRQELIARYENTRERLNALKRQRQNLVHEERHILQDQGAPETPYDSAIPEAETWSAEELERGISEFQGLKEKVVQLKTLYRTQANTVNPNDTDLQERITQKLAQVDGKESQVDEILSQLDALLQRRRAAEARGEHVESHSNSFLSNGAELGSASSGGTSLSATTTEKPPEEVEPTSTTDRQSSEESQRGTYVTTSGIVLELSDIEKNNPQISSTFESLIQMKQKLATLENLSSVLENASKTPGAVTEVLMQQNLGDLLKEQTSDEDQAIAPLPQPERRQKSPLEQLSSLDLLPSTSRASGSMPPRSEAPSVNVNRSSSGLSMANDLPNRRDRTSAEIDRPNIWKHTDNKPPVETLPDPGMEMMKLQEEIRQRKNVMESLRKSMGKSSTFVPDMTENISENVSDNSDHERNPRFCIDPTVEPSYGSLGPAYPPPMQSMMDLWGMRANGPNPAQLQAGPQKNSLSGRVSVNNLAEFGGPSTRPKQNRAPRNLPSQEYQRQPSRQENIEPPEYMNLRAKISQATEEISNLRDTMHSVRNLIPQMNSYDFQNPMNNVSHFQNNFNRPMEMPYPQSFQPNYNPIDHKVLQQINCSLQQCLTLLDLHSLEIMSLNKQMMTMQESVVELRRASLSNNSNRNANVLADRRASFATRDIPVNTEDLGTHPGIYPPWNATGNADLMFENQNFYPTFDGTRPNDYNSLHMSACGVPNEEDLAAFNAESPSNILNNQVLPGSRANNYWDNFRSYSQQNPLTSNSKCNERGATGCTMVRNGPFYQGKFKSRPSGSSHRESAAFNPAPVRNRSNSKNTSSRFSMNNPAVNGTDTSGSLNKNNTFMSGTGVRNVFMGHPENPLLTPLFVEARSNPLQNTHTRVSNLLPDRPEKSTSGQSELQHLPVPLSHSYKDFHNYLDEPNDIRPMQMSPSGSEGHAPEGEILAEVNRLLQSNKVKPQFLLNLFKELSVITQKSDQNFVLDVLRNMSAGKMAENHWHSPYQSNASVRQDRFAQNDDFIQPWMNSTQQSRANRGQEEASNVYVASVTEKVAPKINLPTVTPENSTGAKPKIMTASTRDFKFTPKPPKFSDLTEGQQSLTGTWTSQVSPDKTKCHPLAPLIEFINLEIRTSYSPNDSCRNSKEFLCNFQDRFFNMVREHCQKMHWSQEFVDMILKPVRKLIFRYHYKTMDEIRVELPHAVWDLLRDIWFDSFSYTSSSLTSSMTSTQTPAMASTTSSSMPAASQSNEVLNNTADQSHINSFINITQDTESTIDVDSSPQRDIERVDESQKSNVEGAVANGTSSSVFDSRSKETKTKPIPNGVTEIQASSSIDSSSMDSSVNNNIYKPHRYKKETSTTEVSQTPHNSMNASDDKMEAKGLDRDDN